MPTAPVTEDTTNLDKTYATSGIEGGGKKNVASESKPLTVADIKLVKAFLTKVNDLSVVLKSFDPNKATKATIKPVISNILDIFDMVNGKIDPAIKINKNIDSMFQGIDILGSDQPASKIKDGVMLKVKLGNVINIFKFEKGAWSHRQKDGTFVTINPNEKRGKEIFDQLTDLAKNGQDNTAQIQKDDEEKAKLKKADDEKAADEKGDSETKKTLDAAASTRATATPEKKNKAWNESFRSEYKDYF